MMPAWSTGHQPSSDFKQAMYKMLINENYENFHMSQHLIFFQRRINHSGDHLIIHLGPVSTEH